MQSTPDHAADLVVGTVIELERTEGNTRLDNLAAAFEAARGIGREARFDRSISKGQFFAQNERVLNGQLDRFGGAVIDATDHGNAVPANGDEPSAF